MAWTNIGFDGTINEAQWSQMSTLMGSSGGGYLAAGNGDCLVTAVGGARSVSVAAGSLYGDGIVSTNSAPEVVAMTTPVNGQWYVIALRRTWATNTSALVAIAGATTTTTTPTAPPTSFPTLNTNQGVLTDQPIAWAWCNSANTTVVVYDIRLKGIKSTPPVVANQNERDAKFMTPTQGLQVWRDDLGAVETYFGLYNASTNPGGRDTAGWYTTNRSGGLIPMRPSIVTIASGSGSATSIGQVNFTGATSISLDGVFTPEFKNYRIVYQSLSSVNADVYMRFRVGGTDITNDYYWGLVRNNGSTVLAGNSGLTGNALVISSTTSVDAGAVIDLINVNASGRKNYFCNAFSAAWYWHQANGQLINSSIMTGINFYPSGGTQTGSVTVYGYND